jgi:pimeloyl-ACP methyl ester carboxylesterase
VVRRAPPEAEHRAGSRDRLPEAEHTADSVGGHRERPSVLFLHGQPGGGRDWGRVVAVLAGRAHAIAADRPGWDDASAPRDLRGNARAVIEHLDARGIERATLVGHSLGAAIAAWSAIEHPDRVSALVLAAPAANRASLAALDRWLALPVAGPLSSSISMAGLGLALSVPPLRRRIADRTTIEEAYLRASGRALLSSRAHRAFAVEQRSLLRDLPELESRLAAVEAPTWILTGDEDRIVPPDAPRMLADQIRSARLVELAGAGHLLPQLHAPAVVDAVMLALMAVASH